MARADVGVVGAGLAGLASAIAAAEAGARVHLLAKGHAATHWAGGGLDVGILPGAPTSAAAVELLAARQTHPYMIVGGAMPGALAWIRTHLAAAGLDFLGELTDPVAAVPTAIGATRLATILPAGMAGALAAWQDGERLVVCGPAGFRDFWPEAIAASLRRDGVWRGRSRPARVDAVSVELPGLAGRRNLSGLDLARAFDDPAWRHTALDAMARAIDRAGGGAGPGPGRVALPAVLGLDEHAAVLAAAHARLPLPPFEVALVPPSIPGLRLYRAMRAVLIGLGGRIQVGEEVRGVVGAEGRVERLIAPAAARDFVLSVGSVVLATGGIAGGGLVASPEGTLTETVLGLPVEAPAVDEWLLTDPFEPAGHPLEAAGIRTDAELRPVAGPRHASGRRAARPLAANVHVVGSLLAGQRYLRERCGDGVAIASAVVAARSIAGGRLGSSSAGTPGRDVVAAAGTAR